MKTKFLSFIIFACALALVGCSKSVPDAKPAVPVSVKAIQNNATGFSVGSAMMKNTIYVFFDPGCPHCAALWQTSKPLDAEARFVWIPVGFMGKRSVLQGTAILAAADPASAMEAHEASMRANTGGIALNVDHKAQEAQVKKNTQLLTDFGFTGIPTIVGLNAKTGALTVQKGESGTDALANRFGLDSPFGGA